MQIGSNDEYIFKYYFFNITDLEDLKSQFLHCFNYNEDCIGRVPPYFSDDGKFIIPLDMNSKKLIIIMSPKLINNEFYIKATFFSGKEIDAFIDYEFELNNRKK